MGKYAPGDLRSKQGIVWNALERGHSLTEGEGEGELGKGGYGYRAKASRRRMGPIKTMQSLPDYQILICFHPSRRRS